MLISSLSQSKKIFSLTLTLFFILLSLLQNSAYSSNENSIKSLDKSSSKSLNVLEESVIEEYTATCGSYRFINKYLRLDMPQLIFDKMLLPLMDSALEKITAYKGIAYRGAELPFEEEKDLFSKKPGDLYYDKAYLSSSKSEKVGKRYSGKNGVLFIIESSNGGDLEKAGLGNSNGTEFEVLFARGTKFLIESIDPQKKIVKMIEVTPQLSK
ncbi:MAG: hypothetical protein HQK49_15720 [Oligoflexia bacterium]|nr:hypothetical protein [Oligoflexia bacterium]